MIDVNELVPSAPNNLYPSLDQNTNYKVNQIILVKDMLSKEHKLRKNLKKKYEKVHKTLFGTECLLIIGEVALIGSTFLLVPIAPIVITSVCAGLTLGTASIRAVLKLVQSKIDKHRSIELIASSKLNSIQDKYIKALEDGNISYGEFKDIMKEIDNYSNMKEDVHSKVKKEPSIQITHELKETLKESGREELKKEIKAKLNI